MTKKRTTEVFTGAYASGKSEISINRALELAKKSKITIVDLDTVEPAYTLRPIQDKLRELGLDVIAQTDYTGLGEAGNVITAQQQRCLSLTKNDMVIDVGYGAGGLDVLEVLEEIGNEENLKIYIVINTSKYETSTKDNIVNYINWSRGSKPRDWKKFSGIISNTHFADETTAEDIIRGYNITKQAADELRLPIMAVCMSEAIAKNFDSSTVDNLPIWELKRFMPEAMW